MRVLFVCLGNICRSPLAAGIMKHMFDRRGIAGVVDSAGTADWNAGSKADARAIKVAWENGIDIKSHRARQVQECDFENYDVFIVMDRSNEAALKKMAPKAVHAKIKPVLDGDEELLDPYHEDESAFRDVFKALWHSCERLADRIAN